MTMNPQKALEQISAELQKQYERWQPRARYKHCPDPTAEDVKKLCISLRKNAKEERVLFHYNGHGVPKPTVNGEIWVFNKEFTQYIPLSLYEVQTWMGSPSFYVWDCSNAGIIIQNFLQFEEDRENEASQKGDPNQENIGLLSGGKLQAGESMRPKQSLGGLGVTNIPRLRDSIHLAACGKNELLPMHPDLPLDLFTACLTTPIKAALHWYVSQKNLCQLVPGLTLDLLEKIPGLISDRKTMMGELHWIFTAITDTIAWNVLDSDLFQKLFRQDLLVASLFRNFLLAERIMKSFDCTPVSHPALPSTHEHPLWQSWDLALDMCISQLPQILNTNSSHQPKDFISCGFFTEQIEIFDVWLRFNVNSQTPPEQLPVVLQVLLSQQHRLKALELLGKFLDFGPWAVSSALSVGIFPYVLKLLTTQPKELRPLLTFIWAKILAVDKSCQVELVKDKGHSYFIQVLNDPYVEPTHKVYSVFVLSCLVDNYPAGQESAKQNHLIALCTFLITDKNSADYKNSLLRQWCCICLGLCWQNYPEARWEGVRNTVDKYLIELISDPVPEVRAAAIFALGTYIGCGPGNEASQEQTNELDKKIVNALIKDYDISFIVRKELIAALFNYINQFIANQPSNTTIQHTLLRNSENSSGISSLNSDNSSDSNKTLSKSQSSSTLSQHQHHQQANAKINTIQEHQSGPQNSNPKLVHSTSINQGLSSFTNQSPGFHNSASTSPLHSLPATKRERLISQPSLGQANASMPIKPNASSPVASILPYSNKSFYVIFNRVWNLLVDMQSDPYPDVAEFAQKVVGYFSARAQSFDLIKRNMILQQQQGVQTARRFSSDLTNKSNQPGDKMKDEGNEEEDAGISTEYVQWCRKYFLKPLLPTQPSSKTEELLINRPVDIYTAEFLDQHCKLLYNHKVKRRVPNPWHDHQDMDEGTQIKHNTLPVHCKFHPYDDMLFISDKDSLIHVYDLQNRSVNQPKLSFNNVPQGKSAPTKKSVITSFKVINAQHEPMILTGTDDRVVRLFKPDLMYYRSNQLVTAFTGFGDKEKENSSQKEAGLIIEWDEPNEVLMCAGDTSHIRVWDMNKELYTDYQTNVRSCVSSLSTNSNYTVAGFGDGTIKLFDFRRANPVSLVSGSDLVYQHNVFVLKAQIHRPSSKLISSSTRGDVNIFDIRNMQGCLKSTINNQMATALECHPINELFAIANHNQSINVYDFKGKELASIKYHEGFMRKRIAAVTCLDWNCYKNEIVFGSQDNYLSVFSCKENSY